MTTVAAIFQYILPLLMISIAIAFLCLYCHLKKKRGAYDVTIQMQVNAISWSEDQPEVDPHYDIFPPRYSTIEHPPPYSLFDPRLTNVWPGGAAPAYEMYPITLPLALHYWTPLADSQLSTPPSSPFSHNQPNPQRPHGGPIS